MKKRIVLFVMFIFVLGCFTQAFAEENNIQETELAKKMNDPVVIENLDLNSSEDKKLAEEGLLWAAKYGKEKVAKTLLDKGVNVNAQIDSFLKFTPLSGAVAADNVKMVKFLISKGANVNAQYKPLSKNEFPSDGPIEVKSVAEVGNAPLHLAAILNKIKAAKILLKNGADVNIENVYGQKPLDTAKSEEMKKLLIKYGAKQEKNSKDIDEEGSMKKYNKGVEFYKQGNYKKAKEKFQEALKLNPENSDAALGLKRIEERI